MTSASKSLENKKVYVLSSGGTGGHLFPALSLSDKIEDAGDKALFVTDNRGLSFFKNTDKEPSLVCTIHRNHWLFGRLVYPFSFGFQILRCWVWLKKIQPEAVVGFGGYPSFPCVYAAQMLKIPTFIHEGNAIMGKANRILRPRTNGVALSFPDNALEHSEGNISVTGMPVRFEICKLAFMPYEAPDIHGSFHLLIMGGSQGARIFGSLIPKAIGLLSDDLQKRLVVVHQCREQQLSEVSEEYKKLSCQHEIKTFLNPIENYYPKAHLVIARSGASTVAEVAIAGKPTLFIPFQGSAEGDQAHNAAKLVDANAAWLMREGSLTPEKLATFLKEKMQLPEELATKALMIRNFSHPTAVSKLWKFISQKSDI
jgi:UDP-N-acetylglucosamine--N-acetylmuramyl-(pentapeptide) pyrophosphoryl-undecaprenol N-acetylglucosamine transferase